MILNLILLNLSIIFILFLPGYFLLKALGKNRDDLLGIETITLAIALSIAVIDFIFILINRIQIPINLFSSILFPGIFILGLAFYYFTKKETAKKEKGLINESSKKILKVLLILILFVVAIKVGYLMTKTAPSATDLGHHMYWAKYIQTFHHLPDYGMPDFIIGEHIIFGVIAIISSIPLVSTMPMVVLFIINICSIFAVSLLGHEIALNFTNRKNAQSISLIVFVSIGIFYAIASPQAKFVSGGVIGNLIGNLFIPLLIFSFLKALRTQKKVYAVSFLILLLGLIFTHHLSSFVFLFSALGFITIAIIILGINALKIKDKWGLLKRWREELGVFLNLKYIAGAVLLTVILLLSRIPSYLNPSAIDTAVGTPTKSTRVGLSLMSILESAGPWRFFYAGIGIIILGLILWAIFFDSKKIKKYLEIEGGLNIKTISAITFSVAWFCMLFIMSYRPGLLKIDIPSNRIGSYISFPAALLSGLGAFYLLKISIKSSGGLKKLFPVLFIVIFGTGVVSGLADISSFYEEDYEDKTISQVFAGSEYLAEKTTDSDIVIKDHIYMPADTWVKLFLMRDYKNPLSRSFLKRYNDPVKDRETCTRDMIAIPDSEIGQQCFDEYSTNYVFLKKGYDNQQFEKSSNFSKIFSSQGVVIFQRN